MAVAAVAAMAMRIGGRDVGAGSRATRTVLNPSTGEPLATVPVATTADLDAAVEAAVEAFRTFSRTSFDQRTRYLEIVADAIERNADMLIALEVANVGKLTSEVRKEIKGSIEQFRGFGPLLAEFQSDGPAPGQARLRWDPVGVVGSIIPWNAPMNAMIRRMAVTIATGTTTVVKPSQLAPLTVIALVRVAEEAGLPAGVLNVITGPGGEIGSALANHPGLAKISFTGSQEVGEQILRQAAARFVPAAVELGGKSPQIVAEDAPWDAAVNGVLRGFTRNAGQICTCGTRLLVQDTIADRFVAELAARCEAMNVGPADDELSDMGPVISADQLAIVGGYVDRARAAGRRVVTGGEALDRKGFYYRPTIVTGVEASDEIFQEEVFGPVLAVTTFHDDTEAVELANGTKYGLVAGIWSQDEARSLDLAAGVDAGACWINAYWNSPSWMSRTGHRRSGLGALDFGVEGLREYLVPKQVSIAASGRA